MDDFSPGLESLFEGVDLPFHTPTASAYIKQRDSPVFSSPSTSSSSAYPSPETSTISQSYSPKHKLTVEKWDTYHPTTRLYFPLFDQNYQVFEMEVRTKIDKLANINSDNYSSVDDAYILYRQNQFELEVSVPSLPTQLFIQNNTSFVAIDSFYFHIYAVKQTRKDDTGIPIVDNEDVAELIQHLSAREKKEVQVPPPMPVVNGQVVFSRLQFKSATLNNARTNPDQPHPNQQYFRLVLSLIVKIEDTFHFVMSRISPRLILRGRNPGNFNHSPSHEVPTPLSIEQPPQNSSRQTKRQRVPQQQQQQQPLQPPPPQSQPQPQTPQQQQQQPQTPQQPLQSEQLLQQQIQNQLAAMQQQQQQQQPMRMAQPQVHTQRHVQLQLQQEMLQQQELLKQQELQNFLLQQQLESELNPHHPPPLMSASHTTTTTTTTSAAVMQPMMASQPTYSPQAHPLQQPPQQAIPTHLQAPILPKREQDNDIQQQPLLQLSQSQSFDTVSSSQQISQQQQQNPRKSQKRTYLDAKMNMPDPKDGIDDGWQMDSRGNIYLSGKVGINTLPTEEALTVHGNVLVTGNYLKPSDERVKTNIKSLDGKKQLENIERLQLYEYDLKHERGKDGASLHETGVLAQELRKVLPQAVQVLQNVTLSDGTLMPELLVVQDRALLYENIGATKQLGAEVRKNQANLTALQKRSQELKAVTNRAFAAVGRSLDYLLTETGDDYNRDDIKAKWCYCTLFGLGPAWTVYFLGFILPPLWLFGIFYISSFQHVKKLAGFFSAISLCLYIAFIALIFSMPVPPATYIAAPVAVAALGFVLLFGPIAMSWGQKQRRRKYYKFAKKKVHKARLRQELGVVNEALQEDEEEERGTV